MLHFAAQKGLKWKDGMKEISSLSHHMIDVPDTNSNLYPFSVAASGENSDLTVIYQLLLLNPSLCQR